MEEESQDRCFMHIFQDFQSWTHLGALWGLVCEQAARLLDLGNLRPPLNVADAHGLTPKLVGSAYFGDTLPHASQMCLNIANARCYSTGWTNSM